MIEVAMFKDKEHIVQEYLLRKGIYVSVRDIVRDMKKCLNSTIGISAGSIKNYYEIMYDTLLKKECYDRVTLMEIVMEELNISKGG